jgi:hypothetical protein
MSLSDKKKMEIANVCYANVAGDFAMFTNEKCRGPSFKWEDFPQMMERSAQYWMMIHAVYDPRVSGAEVDECAASMAREIAEKLIERAQD